MPSLPVAIGRVHDAGSLGRLTMGPGGYIIRRVKQQEVYMRIVTIFSGIFLIGTGIWCFAHPGAPFISIAFVLGIAMMISGLSNLFAYVVFRKHNPYVPWQFADGLLTAIFAGVILSNTILTDGMVVLFFGMWIQFSGVLRITASMVMYKNEIAGWYWTFAPGILSLLTGIYSFFNPLLAGLALVIMIGVIFILQGVNCVAGGIFLKYESRQCAKEKGQKIGRHSHEGTDI
jgi:uncharacterized membrane protein HdeD (DUF308 family)